MRSRLLPIFLALALLPLAQLLYPGCATVVDGPTQQIRVKSKPKGAQVFLNGKPVGVTPVTTRVSRWGWHRIRIEMPGFEPYEVSLEKHFNGNAGGNLFIGGVWIVIDALTGAIYDLGVSSEEQRKLVNNEWEKGDPHGGAIFSPYTRVITVGLHPAGPVGPAQKIGQMKRK
ncbi:MAG: PEGA domain-containing protein [Chthoniobacter sp.]|nr:PEGA domain-containing protein [Chthoniobacter sp.]